MKKKQNKILLGSIIVATVLSVSLSMQTAVQAGGETLHSWDTKIDDASKRFGVLADFNGAAVLDRETGLVWEQSPSTGTFTWEDAQNHCNKLNTGGRLGWRLPALQELVSLVDPTQTNPSLASGHPFSNVQSSNLSNYWSATTNADFASVAWVVNFGPGSVSNAGSKVNDTFFVWCVRGGHGVDPQ